MKTDTGRLLELAERCEQATGPDRELIERLFGEFGVFRMAIAGWAGGANREKVAETIETKRQLESLISDRAKLREAAQPFADSIVIDPTKKRGDRHWATYGKPTDLDDVLRLQAALKQRIDP